MKTVAYLKTFLDRQNVREQRQAILEFAQREEITLSCFIEMSASSTSGKRIGARFVNWLYSVQVIGA